MLMPDFALAVPTPHDHHSLHLHHLHDDMLGTTSALPISHPVRFGALIRLWIAEEDVNSKMAGCGGGGFLGFAAQDLRRIQVGGRGREGGASREWILFFGSHDTHNSLTSIPNFIFLLHFLGRATAGGQV